MVALARRSVSAATATQGERNLVPVLYDVVFLYLIDRPLRKLLAGPVRVRAAGDRAGTPAEASRQSTALPNHAHNSSGTRCTRVNTLVRVYTLLSTINRVIVTLACCPVEFAHAGCTDTA